MSADLQPKPLSNLKAYLTALRTNLRLFGEVLVETERVVVILFGLLLTIIGGLTLIGAKVNIGYLVRSVFTYLMSLLS